VSASARFPAHRFSLSLHWCLFLVSPPAAVAEEVYVRLGRRPASTAGPPAFVVLSVANLFQVDSSWSMPTL